MKVVVSALAAVLGLFLLYAAVHLTLIEVGQEIVVLHKPNPEGPPSRARLWIVDGGGHTWLHHGYAGSYWIQRLAEDPVVKIERGGETLEYRATPDTASDPEVHRLMREKYGFADRLVRFWSGTNTEAGFATRRLCDAVPVRLERL
jgi:hypothetical protein